MFFCDCILLAVFPEMALAQEENEQVMKEDTEFMLTSYKTTRWTSLHPPSFSNKQTNKQNSAKPSGGEMAHQLGTSYSWRGPGCPHPHQLAPKHP